MSVLGIAQYENTIDIPILELRNITKVFNGVRALDQVDFQLRKGEVSVLIGENGAGKSTLIKIIAGAYQPNSGEIYFNGEKVDFNTPQKALEKGISVVYQEFNLSEQLNTYENIFASQQLLKNNGIFKTLDKSAMIRRSQELMEEIGANIDVNLPVRELSVAQKQMVEIAKALCFDSEILILDEPTAVLTERETKQLFEIIHRLKEKGLAICFIIGTKPANQTVTACPL